MAKFAGVQRRLQLAELPRNRSNVLVCLQQQELATVFSAEFHRVTNREYMFLVDECGEYRRVLFARDPLFGERFVQLALNHAVMSNFEQHQAINADEKAEGGVAKQKVLYFLMLFDSV